MILYFGLLLSIFFEYVRPATYFPVIAILKLYSVVPLSVLVLSSFARNCVDHKKIFRSSNFRWLLFFLSLLLISVLTADVTSYSYKIFIRVLGFVILFYLIARLVTSLDRIRYLLIVLVVSHVLLLILNPNIILDPSTRTYVYENAFLGDGNDFALSLCVVLPLCLYLLVSASSIVRKVLWGAVLLVLILGVIGTQSRGGSLALFSVIFFLWFFGRKKIVGMVLIGALSIIVFQYAQPVYLERMQTILNYQEEESAQGRIIAWKTAVRMVQKHPFTGVGAGHFPVKLGTDFRPPEFGDRNLPWLTAHSAYFLVLGELGVPGILCLLYFLVSNFFKNLSFSAVPKKDASEEDKSRRRLFIMLNGSLVAYAVGSAFLSVAYYPHIYILLGIFTASHHLFAGFRPSQKVQRPRLR